MVKSIMIQGAGSNVGKSIIVAGLCRAFVRRGLKVLPFKPQNMSNNAAVTMDGGEIGRAQALQARACKVIAHSDMNPVLLKPQTETGAQVVVQGTRVATLKARDYSAMKATLMPKVLQSFHRLGAQADLVLVEGAGSPAEVNLRGGDIANMGFARAANIPVILVGDIDRGGVLAQLVGTHVLMDAEDDRLIKGFLVNKFRGDLSLFDEGLQIVRERTQWCALGVLPWFADAHKLPAEDAADLTDPAVHSSRDGAMSSTASCGNRGFKIAVPGFSRIANFDDLDPLKIEPGVTVVVVGAGHRLPDDADLILLPGSKSTIGDLQFLREQGWDRDLMRHVERNKPVLGICGGYQMLGRVIKDPAGIEGPAGEIRGLGLLDIETLMTPEKRLAEVQGIDLESGAKLAGYEIHIGQTNGPDCQRPWLEIEGRREGAVSKNGQVRGCYVHGLFSSDAFRRAFLENCGAQVSGIEFEQVVEQTLDALADHIEEHLDVDMILAMAGEVNVVSGS